MFKWPEPVSKVRIDSCLLHSVGITGSFLHETFGSQELRRETALESETPHRLSHACVLYFFSNCCLAPTLQQQQQQQLPQLWNQAASGSENTRESCFILFSGEDLVCTGSCAAYCSPISKKEEKREEHGHAKTTVLDVQTGCSVLFLTHMLVFFSFSHHCYRPPYATHTESDKSESLRLQVLMLSSEFLQNSIPYSLQMQPMNATC